MSINDDLKINFDKVGKACKQVGEEWEKMMRENNPFDTISKIAKDIADKQDNEMALEFTKCICELLKKNGVTPMIDEYRHETMKENSIECRYGVAITGLDFTEHDKPFERRIKKLESLRYRCHESERDSFDNGNYGILHIVTADELKNDDKVKELQCELDKTYNQLMEVEKEAQEQIARLKSELGTKVNFETDRLVKLPFDALETANMLINAKYRRKANGIDRFRGCEEDTIETDMYSVGDLEQIAEHLLVYCKHNKNSEE